MNDFSLGEYKKALFFKNETYFFFTTTFRNKYLGFCACVFPPNFALVSQRMCVVVKAPPVASAVCFFCIDLFHLSYMLAVNHLAVFTSGHVTCIKSRSRAPGQSIFYQWDARSEGRNDVLQTIVLAGSSCSGLRVVRRVALRGCVVVVVHKIFLYGTKLHSTNHIWHQPRKWSLSFLLLFSSFMSSHAWSKMRS